MTEDKYSFPYLLDPELAIGDGIALLPAAIVILGVWVYYRNVASQCRHDRESLDQFRFAWIWPTFLWRVLIVVSIPLTLRAAFGFVFGGGIVNVYAFAFVSFGLAYVAWRYVDLVDPPALRLARQRLKWLRQEELEEMREDSVAHAHRDVDVAKAYEERATSLTGMLDAQRGRLDAESQYKAVEQQTVATDHVRRENQKRGRPKSNAEKLVEKMSESVREGTITLKAMQALISQIDNDHTLTQDQKENLKFDLEHQYEDERDKRSRR